MTAVGTPVVDARGLVQRLGGFQVGPLDLRLDPGDRLAVLGDNGAGKTTLLRLLATLARPAAGRLDLFGLDAASQRERVRPRLGYLGHRPGLYEALTARENLRFFATLQGVSQGWVDEALAAVDLDGLAVRRVAELSRGLQQRLALARALLHRPELLVLDEPDASLDHTDRRLQPLLEGRTVVLATHDRGLARRLCGRALLLRDGRDGGDPFRVQVVAGG